jgi:hypothetical protein
MMSLKQSRHLGLFMVAYKPASAILCGSPPDFFILTGGFAAY